MRIRFLIIFFSISFACIFAPQNIFSGDIEKANEYYDKYDYKFALEIYEKLMLKKPTLEIAQKLANCYRFINDTEDAEKAYFRIFSFKNFDPVNYKYYADALKQNGKFELAKRNYQLYGENSPENAADARILANSCDVARIWTNNPDLNTRIENFSAVNSEFSEFSPVKYGKDYIFVSDRWFVKSSVKDKKELYGWTGNPFLKLYELKGESSEISVLPNTINTEFHNGPAVFTENGIEIYFTRTEEPKTKEKPVKIGRKFLYHANRVANNWSKPEVLPFNKEATFSVQHPALSPDGNTLYFASDKPGGFGKMDIYYSEKQADGTWGEMINCGPQINTTEDDVFPYISESGKFYFSSKGHIGLGGLDVFVADGSFNKFSEPENMKVPFNSPKDDFGVLFISDVTGMLSSNRKGSRGMDDIFKFTIVPKQELYFAIDGDVVDKETGLPKANVLVSLVNQTTGEEKTTYSDIAGKFSFNLEKDAEYIVRGDPKLFFSKQEGVISTKNTGQSTVFKVKFEVEKADNNYVVQLKNIYYDFDKYNIRPDAVPDLNKVVAFMNIMPNVTIELRSHTDSRGPAVYNLWLSQKRAESATSYLQTNGVENSRLSAKGLGETELLNRCSDGVKCSKAEHQLNRRTEFKIISVPIVNASVTRIRK